MSKLRVGVFMGGKSVEKEVSFNSGRTVCDHLDAQRYEVLPIFQRANGDLYILPWRFLHRGKISDFDHRLDTQAQRICWDDLKTLIDFMYIAAHGRFAEDGIVQGFLEVLHIPYLGSKVLASAISMNKTVQKEILKAHNIRVPNGFTVQPHELTQLTAQDLQSKLEKAELIWPVICKPQGEGSSLGISVSAHLEELIDAVQKAGYINSTKPQAVLIEEYITGMEFTAIIITDPRTGEPVPLPPTEIIPETAFFDYEQKYMPGRATKFTPARCSAEVQKKIQDTSIQVMRALDIQTIARIDGFVLADKTIVITDPNTLAGMAPSSFVFRQAAELNMGHTDFINHLIKTELARYAMLTSTQDLYNPQSAQDTNNRLRVGVLMGGASHEKEISLESGRNIVYKLSPHTYEAIPLFVDAQLSLHKIDHALLVRNSTKELELGLKPAMHVKWSDLPNLVDFVFIGLHGGAGENGSIQGTLEMLGLPYNGSSVLASALCMDKYKTTHYLKHQGFHVPASVLIARDRWLTDQAAVLAQIQEQLTSPYISKPHDDGCSVLVYKANTENELIEAIEAIFADGKSHALIEEYITGMELTVGVLGNNVVTALPPSRAVTTGAILSIEEKFLPGAGENQTPAPLPHATLELVKRTIEQVYKALNCRGYARIDCFYQSAQESTTGQERVIVLEVNTLPGMTPATCIFHQAAELGMRPMDFIDRIIELGLQEHIPLSITYNSEEPTIQF